MSTRLYHNVLPLAASRWCVYCAAESSVLDHYLPWIHFGKPYTVPCCRQCNGYLVDFWFPTLQERVRYLLQTYKRKYKKELGIEVSRVKGGTRGRLKKELEKVETVQEVIRAKLAALQFGVDTLPCIPLESLHSTPSSLDALMAFLQLRDSFSRKATLAAAEG